MFKYKDIDLFSFKMVIYISFLNTIDKHVFYY